jgi:hypothetical protein
VLQTFRRFGRPVRCVVYTLKRLTPRFQREKKACLLRTLIRSGSDSSEISVRYRQFSRSDLSHTSALALSGFKFESDQNRQTVPTNDRPPPRSGFFQLPRLTVPAAAIFRRQSHVGLRASRILHSDRFQLILGSSVLDPSVDPRTPCSRLRRNSRSESTSGTVAPPESHLSVLSTPVGLTAPLPESTEKPHSARTESLRT